jgi:hypothetical protein
MSRVTLFELGFLLLPIGLLLIAITRNRPRVDRFAEVNGLDLDDSTVAMIGASLDRTRRSRVNGAWGGFVTGTAAGALMAQSIGASGWTIVFNAVAGLLVGSFVGIAISQRTAPPDLGAERSASLTVRDVDAYRTRHGSFLIRVAVAGFVTAATLVLVTAEHEVVVTVVATLAVATAGLAFVWWARRIAVRTVERARVADPMHAAVDDCLRACAVRAMQHATVGVLACGIGLLALVGINTHTYEAVKIDGRAVFEVPDGGHLDEVHTADLSAIVDRATVVTIRWTDADGRTQTARRIRPPGVYLGSGAYVDGALVISLGGLGLIVSLVVGLREWSASAKAWRHPAPPRLEYA